MFTVGGLSTIKTFIQEYECIFILRRKIIKLSKL